MAKNCELTANYQKFLRVKRPKQAHHGDYTRFHGEKWAGDLAQKNCKVQREGVRSMFSGNDFR